MYGLLYYYYCNVYFEEKFCWAAELCHRKSYYFFGYYLARLLLLLLCFFCCKICLLLQDYLRAELQNITQCCLFLMLYAWIALNWAGRHAYSQPTTYYYIYTYLLVFEWLLYFESIALDIKPNCMNSVLIIHYHFKIEISLIPGQMLGALFTSANIHTYWQLAVGKTL